MAVSVDDLDHFRLLAEVRWQAFRNSLGMGFKRVEVLVRALTWTIGLGVVALVALVFFLDGYFLFLKRPYITHLLLWVLAFVWQVLPLVLEGSSPALDFREFVRYPVRFRLFYVMSVGYGLLDPAALACVTWLGALALGIMVAHPSTIPWVLLFFSLFALLNLLFNRVLFGWIRAATATRRRREILVASSMILLFIVQVAFWVLMPQVEKLDRKAQLLPVIESVNRYSPMGMTANALYSPRESALPALVALGGGCLFFGFLLYRQLRPIYLGETESDSEARSGAVQAEPGWKLPGVGPEVSALFEREVRYFFRENRLWVNQLSIWMFIFVGTLAPRFLQQAFGWNAERRAEMLYPIAVSYSLVVLATLTYNCFWSDGGGFYRLLLSPVSMRRVLLAKNLFFGVAVMANLVVITTIVSLGISLPPLRLTNGVLTTLFIALGVVSAGNLLSGWFPKRIKSGSFNTKNASEAATFIGLMVLAVLSAGCFVASWAGKRWEQPLATPALLGLGILLAGALYLLTLRYATRYLETHQDKMAAELA